MTDLENAILYTLLLGVIILLIGLCIYLREKRDDKEVGEFRKQIEEESKEVKHKESEILERTLLTEETNDQKSQDQSLTE